MTVSVLQQLPLIVGIPILISLPLVGVSCVQFQSGLVPRACGSHTTCKVEKTTFAALGKIDGGITYLYCMN